MTQMTQPTFDIISLDCGYGVEMTDTDGAKYLEFASIEIEALFAERKAVLRVALVDRENSHLDYCSGSENIDVSAVRADMREWLDEYMTVRADVDFGDVLSGRETLDAVLVRSAGHLLARRDAFLSGDYTPLSARWQLYWLGREGCGDLDGGIYDTAEQAKAARIEFLGEILDQCAEDEQRAGVLAGSMGIYQMVGKECWAFEQTSVESLGPQPSLAA